MAKTDKKDNKQELYLLNIAEEARKSVTRFQKQLAKSIQTIQIPTTQIGQIQETARAVSKYHKSLLAQINPVIEMQKQLNEQARQMSEAFKAAIPKIDFKQLSEIAQNLADEGVRLDVLIKTGWWYCPSMMSIEANLIKNAALKYKRGNKNSMTNLIKTSYHQDDYSLLKDTVNTWKTNPLFEKRSKVIDDALEAHIQGKYTLSIPALLPLVEGIAADYCKSKGIDIERFRSKGKVKVEKAFEELAKLNKYSFKFPDLFLQIIAEVVYQDTSKAKDPFRKKLNRHGVLHGAYVNYYDAPRSLRCFLMLDALSSLK